MPVTPFSSLSHFAPTCSASGPGVPSCIHALDQRGTPALLAGMPAGEFRTGYQHAVAAPAARNCIAHNPLRAGTMADSAPGAGLAVAAVAPAAAAAVVAGDADASWASGTGVGGPGIQESPDLGCMGWSGPVTPWVQLLSVAGVQIVWVGSRGSSVRRKGAEDLGVGAVRVVQGLQAEPCRSRGLAEGHRDRVPRHWRVGRVPLPPEGEVSSRGA